MLLLKKMFVILTRIQVFDPNHYVLQGAVEGPSEFAEGMAIRILTNKLSPLSLGRCGGTQRVCRGHGYRGAKRVQRGGGRRRRDRLPHHRRPRQGSRLAHIRREVPEETARDHQTQARRRLCVLNAADACGPKVRPHMYWGWKTLREFQDSYHMIHY
jgi:hypothetical protein